MNQIDRLHPDIMQALTHHVKTCGEQVALRFLPRGEFGHAVTWTYAELDARAKAIATYLYEMKMTGKVVLLAYPSGLEFIAALMACFYAGVIAVPAHSPTSGRQRTARFMAIANDCGATLALTDNDTLIRVNRQRNNEQQDPWPNIHWLSTQDLTSHTVFDYVTYSELAFIQYTSGSTQLPRGVMISHTNLVANLQQIHQHLGINQIQPHIISWLPQYHDMGLIGAMLYPLYFGCPVSFFSPLTFIKNPLCWLQAITHYRGTITTAPTFGYDMVTQNIAANDLAKLDLQCLETAICGAEPVRFDVLQRFTAIFAPYGFKPEALYPSYGLAESTLFVSTAQGSPETLICGFSRAALSEGWALPFVENSVDEQLNSNSVIVDKTSYLVSCGCVSASKNLRIVNPDTLLPCPAGKIGEIWLTGQSIARGYYRQSEASMALFDARLADTGDGPWLRTGDLGFVMAGQLYVTGRRKTLMIIQGRNYYPQDFEILAEAVIGVMAHGSAAFSIPNPQGEEQLVLVVEYDKHSQQPADHIVQQVYQTIVEQMECQLYGVVLVKRGQIPRTTSGKIQHHACRIAFLEKRLQTIAIYNQPNVTKDITEYTDLSVFHKLDQRGLKYRFDEELDIAWSHLQDTGLFFPDHYYSRCGIDINALNTNAKARKIFDWCTALSVCISFDIFEVGLIHFVHAQQLQLGETTSIKHLITEEEKHIRVFRRYAQHLAMLYPELINTARQLCDQSADFIASIGSDQHYAMLLQFLFIESSSVYLHDVLNSQADAIQPTWLSLHAAHAREESQHLVTTAAYLNAHQATNDEKAQILYQKFQQFDTGFQHISNIYAPLQLVSDLFPNLKLIEQAPQLFNTPFFNELLTHRCFRWLREIAPDLANMNPTTLTPNQPKLILLLSAPRCGSTLLRAMLSAHPQLCCPPELNLLSFSDMQQREQALKAGQTHGLAQLLTELDNISLDSANGIVDTWLQQNITTQNIFVELFQRCATQTVILVDKSPHYAHDLNILQQAEALFPKQVMYIHLLRHPYPAILSFAKTGLDQLYREPQQIDISAEAVGEYTWTTYNRNILDFLVDIDDQYQYRLYFEDLMHNPSLILTQLCQWLGLEFYSEMLNPYQKGRMLTPLTADALTGDPNFLTKTALDKTRADAWKTDKLSHSPSLSLQQLSQALGFELPDVSQPTVEVKPNASEQDMQHIIQSIFAEKLQLTPEQIPVDQPLTSFGLASLALMRLVATLEIKLGFSINAMVVFDYPTIAALAVYLVKQSSKSSVTMSLRDPNPNMRPEAKAIYETVLQNALGNVKTFDFNPNPAVIFLTGCTGFLGAHLLAEFLAETEATIICLIRVTDPQVSATQRLQQNLSKYGLWQSDNQARIIAMTGDLSQVNFGLNEADYQKISDADLICHNAAQVDFLASYEKLKPANVDGTCEILKLGVTQKVTPILYISSGAVFGTCLDNAQRWIFENDRLDYCEGLFLGYMQSKWVAEKLVWYSVEQHGLPITVYRPAIIAGHTQNGAFSQSEFLYRLLQTCLQLGIYPDLDDVQVDASPVDYVSKAVVLSALKQNIWGSAIHLNHPAPISFNQLMQTLAELSASQKLQKVDIQQWQQQLLANSQNTALGGLELLFQPMWQGERNIIDFRRKRPEIDAHYSADMLKRLDLVCPPLTDEALLTRWFLS